MGRLVRNWGIWIYFRIALTDFLKNISTNEGNGKETVADAQRKSPQGCGAADQTEGPLMA